MLFRKVYGVDLGTSTIKVFSLSKNKTFIEKNMVAIKDGKKVMAVGDEAYEMFEKAPKNIEVNSPMAFGMIADIRKTEVALYSFMRKIDWTIRFGGIIYFAVPADLTEIEKRAYYAIANGVRLQNNKVFIIERPIADAIALGLSVEETRGSMIVNIGSQSTEISVIADGKVILSKIVPVGGRQINIAICDEIRSRYKLQIGTRTARRLKTSMGDLYSQKSAARKAVGIGSLSGLPREEVISSHVVNEAIEIPMKHIGDEILGFLKRVPPQIAYMIQKEGIHLTGGSARILNIEKYLAQYTGHSIVLSHLYETCTVYGIEKIIRDKDMQKYAATIRQRKL